MPPFHGRLSFFRIVIGISAARCPIRVGRHGTDRRRHAACAGAARRSRTPAKRSNASAVCFFLPAKESVRMIVCDQWTELLACSNCGTSGPARFSRPENRAYDFSVEAVPAGFKVVRLEFGDTFYCEACNRPADTNRCCPLCDEMPRIVRKILDSRTGKTVCMFECKCGEHSWSE
jgi:hypothetical protein